MAAGSDFHLFSPKGIALSLGAFLVVAAIYGLGVAIYNVFFHPLKHIPGPLYARATGYFYASHLRNGSIHKWVRKLHEQYGDVVRVSPTEISFITGETAWQDIYGFRTGKNKTPPYLKDRSWYPKPNNGTYSVIAADEANHSKYRRALSHAFSDKALREQEDIIQGFVSLLVHRLHDQVQDGFATVDIMRWYNYTTFDIIADLTFGEPLYCLRDKDYHPWVNLVFAAAKAIGLINSRLKYPFFDYYDRVADMFKDNGGAVKMRRDFLRLTSEKVANRLEKESGRHDFMSYVLKNQDTPEKRLNKDEMDSNSALFLIAGSETTATMLSGTTYLLLKNPEIYAKLVNEIRSKFRSQSEITIEEVNKLEYMVACLNEGLRYYPPVPTGFPRVVPSGGDHISGYYIPEGTSVYMSQHAANHSPRNYTNPDAFVPERWLGDSHYKDDNRAVHQPFSFGPRNCLGKNLAYAEMRLIVAKVLWNFDIELVDKTQDWMDQRVFTLWEKPALMVRLKPVQR